MRVQLVIPPAEDAFPRSRWMMPLGILSIATHIRQKLSLASVEVLDGNLLSECQIIERIGADILGVSVNIANYASAKSIIYAAKAQRCPLVVAGGPLPTTCSRRLQTELPEVDLLVQGDGEESFSSIVCGQVPVAAHRYVTLDTLPIVDRSFIDTEQYINAYKKIHPNSPWARPFTIYSQKGCRHRYQHGGCKFCSIADRGWRARSPSSVWQEIMMLESAYGSDLIWDVSDSIASSILWLEEFARSRPKEIRSSLYCYIRPDEVTTQSIDLLHEINCKQVFLGAETGNDAFLVEANKGSTTKDNIAAAQLLDMHNIGIRLSFIIGFPGENEKTISNTQAHIEELIPYGVEMLNAHVMTPEPGSAYYSMLTRRAGIVPLDPEKLRSKWAEHFCELSLASLYDACEVILSYVPDGQERDYGCI